MRFRTIILQSFIWLLLPLGLSGKPVAQVNAEARQDLDIAVRRLAEQRKTIAEEKVELSRSANQAKELAKTKRRDLERRQRLKDNASLELDKLREQNRKLEEDLTYVSNLFLDYSSEFDATIDIIEKSTYSNALKTLRESTGNEAPTPEEFALNFASCRRRLTGWLRLPEVIASKALQFWVQRVLSRQEPAFWLAPTASSATRPSLVSSRPTRPPLRPKFCH